MKTQIWLINILLVVIVFLFYKNWSMDQALLLTHEEGYQALPNTEINSFIKETKRLEEPSLTGYATNDLDGLYGHWTAPEKKKYVADPDGALDEGFEWTNEYYDPERVDEPGYRDMVVSAIYAKHYYEAPERKLPPFQQSKELLERWGIESTIDNTVMVHDAANEWHMYKQFSEEDSGPAAGADGKKMAAFKMDFQRKNITSRLEHFLGIKDKTFFEELIQIEPESGILTPLLIIKPGDRLMRRTD